MQRAICEILKAEIEALNLSWFDRVYGMVETISEKVPTVGGGVTVKQYPAYRNPGQRGCNAANDYTKCLPETALRSLLYMEANEPQQTAHTFHYDEFNMRVNIVLWLNLKKLNPSYMDASDFVDELMGELPKALTNTTPYHTLRLHLASCQRDLGIVNKYTYDEAENQMWLYPFDFSVVSVDVKFRRTANCHGSIIYNPSTCNRY